MHHRLILLCTLFGIGFTPFANAQLAIETAVKNFLTSLSADEAKSITYSFEDAQRLKWTNLPVGMVPRPGLQYGALSDQSRMAFHRVLSALLSSQGYLKTTSIMHLDDILNTLYQEAYDKGEIKADMLKRMQDLKWAYGNYYIAIWGAPQDKQPWGLNFGGHHLALNVTVSGQAVSLSPFFYGTDPSEVKSSKYAGWRVLSKEEDYGFMLVNALTEKQQEKAILSQSVPRDILTNPNSSQRITSYYGLSAGEMDATQQTILKLLVEEYLHNFEHQTAHRLTDEMIKTGLDKVYFAWIGSLENNQSHYYIIHTPDFLIEYDNHNGGNHIHAITREKDSDFGADLLKMHLEKDHQGNKN